MKETSFIEQNKEKWKRLENAYSSDNTDPEELSDLYMDMTNDLGYAQTFYHKRTVRVYLNLLAQKVFSGVHKQKSESFRKFFEVWKVSLPLEIYRSRKNLTFALICFLIYFLIGVASNQLIPKFANMVLGDAYIAETMENIKKGDLLGIYTDKDQVKMFMMIATNNLRVAFLTFFTGFFLTIGAQILMFYNGIMVGTFQHFFISKGLFIASFLGIWIHGAFEISAIVLAGGAGITAGNGFLFPGSYSRLQALQLSTKRGLKIMLSLVPFIVFAAVLESFVTANYDVFPDWSKWFLILLCFGVILFFYVLYPIYVARKHPHLVDNEQTEINSKEEKFNFHEVRTIGNTITTTFRFYAQTIGKLSKIIFLIVFPIGLIFMFIQSFNYVQEMKTLHWFDWSYQLEIILGNQFKSIQDFVVFGCWTVIFSTLNVAIFWLFKSNSKVFSWKDFFKFLKLKFFASWIISFVVYAQFFLMSWSYFVFLIPIIALILVLSPAFILEEGPIKVKLKKAWKYSVKQFGNSLLLMLFFGSFLAILSQSISSVFSIYNETTQQPFAMRDLLDMVAEFVDEIARHFTKDYLIYSNFVRQIVYILFIFFFIPLLWVGATFLYFTEKEKHEAIGLREQFKKFGKRSRVLETEVDFE